ncbi:MAG: hypothetical protein JJU00_11655 [Opitutales bacterium]|nr:hypothetical protein [Opitutales bacterium]
MNNDKSFVERSEQLLRTYARHAWHPLETIWGRYRCFDGLFLALFAAGDVEGGRRLLAETLDMVDKNIGDELSGRGDKWHLGDFALHAVWRGFRTYPAETGDDLAARIRERLLTYPYHPGGMSENHNLLQHALRCLAGHAFPGDRFRDGRNGAGHHAESTDLIQSWCKEWLDSGSSEWGADIYDNVNLLSLCNLFDYAPSGDLRAVVRSVLDALATESALNAFDGATAGAARRGYACYRMSTRNSPSRPLHYLWFGSGRVDFDVPWFVGGVLVAAHSGYRPPAETLALARHPGPLRSADWNRRPFYQPGVDIAETFRVTTRLPGAQLSGTVIPASPSRYTDFTWVACLGEDAVVFANHPRPTHPGHKSDASGEARALLEGYRRGTFPARERPHWVPGNYPPGWDGERRPGYWQGHGCAPACWMQGSIALNLFHIDPAETCPWFHVFLPSAAFDEVVRRGPWLFARRGKGLLRLWASTPLEAVGEGTWAGVEWRSETTSGALFVEIGSLGDSPAEWNTWVDDADSRAPRFDPATPAVSVVDDCERVRLDRSAAFADSRLPPRRRRWIHGGDAKAPPGGPSHSLENSGPSPRAGEIRNPGPPPRKS